MFFKKACDSEISGFILIKNHWNLSDLFVLPEEHGKGIGKALFNTAKKLCKLKQDKNYILVNSSSNAVDFYRKLGFKTYTPIKEVPDFVVPLIYNL